jgi:hypothetical protein
VFSSFAATLKNTQMKLKLQSCGQRRTTITLSEIFKAVSKSYFIHHIKGIRHVSTAWKILQKRYQSGDMQSYICTADINVGLWLTEIKHRYNQ